MAKTATETLIAATGSIYVAEVGEAFPETIDDAIAGAWQELGYTTPDGLSHSFDRSVTDHPVWQSDDPVRSSIESIVKTLKFVLVQANGLVLPFVYGGGAVEETAPGNFEYSFPDATDGIDERALIGEFEDGDKKYRYLVARGMVVESVETQHNRTALAQFPVAFKALKPDTGHAVRLQTNDESMAEAS